jgi:hypothetical protein
MREFCSARDLPDAERRITLAGGCPGLAATLDLEVYEKRRALALALLESAAGEAPFVDWVKRSESFLASKTEKLDLYFKPLYSLLEDVLVLANGGGRIRNADIAPALERLASRVSFEWIRTAAGQVDEIVGLQRRNVQKGLTLDSFVVTQRTVR